jgi:hypothetical protein
MMKFVINHPSEFSRPYYAFICGMTLFSVTICTELMAIAFLSTLDVAIEIIIKQVAMACIAKVGLFFVQGMSANVKIRQPSTVSIEITNYRDIRPLVKLGPGQSKYMLKVFSCIYMVLRLFYCAVIYYMLPTLALVMPLLAGLTPCWSSV